MTTTAMVAEVVKVGSSFLLAWYLKGKEDAMIIEHCNDEIDRLKSRNEYLDKQLTYKKWVAETLTPDHKLSSEEAYAVEDRRTAGTHQN